MNQYFANIAPYFLEDDQKNMSPVFQNAGAQQSYMNQQLGDANKLAQYQSYGTSAGGSSALALAQALRKKKPEMMGNSETPNWENPYANYNNGASSGSSGIE
jgi:hypothetical protein